MAPSACLKARRTGAGEAEGEVVGGSGRLVAVTRMQERQESGQACSMQRRAFLRSAQAENMGPPAGVV